MKKIKSFVAVVLACAICLGAVVMLAPETHAAVYNLEDKIETAVVKKSVIVGVKLPYVDDEDPVVTIPKDPDDKKDYKEIVGDKKPIDKNDKPCFDFDKITDEISIPRNPDRMILIDEDGLGKDCYEIPVEDDEIIKIDDGIIPAKPVPEPDVSIPEKPGDGEEDRKGIEDIVDNTHPIKYPDVFIPKDPDDVKRKNIKDIWGKDEKNFNAGHINDKVSVPKNPERTMLIDDEGLGENFREVAVDENYVIVEVYE